MQLINKTVAAAVIAALSLTVNAAPEDAARFHRPNDSQPTKAQTQAQPKAQPEAKARIDVQKDVSEPKVDASSLRNTATTEERARAAAQLADVAVQSQNPSSGSGNPVRINKSNVIRVNPGENVFISISREHPNRLITPFKNPQVISSSLSGGTKKRRMRRTVCSQRRRLRHNRRSPSRHDIHHGTRQRKDRFFHDDDPVGHSASSGDLQLPRQGDGRTARKYASRQS